MAGSINKVILVGRAGKDPESREFQGGGKVVTFSLATSESWRDKTSGERQERTQWHQIAIWNEALGEVATRFVKKGSQLYLEGQLEHREYEKDGERRFATEVVLRPFNGEIQLLDKAPERPAEPPAQSGRQQRKPSGPR
jgi:single-strand DNA-binding protein